VEELLIFVSLATSSGRVIVHLLETGRVFFEAEPGLGEAPRALVLASALARGVSVEEIPGQETEARTTLAAPDLVIYSGFVVYNVVVGLN
jgi:hypothetical protein